VPHEREANKQAKMLADQIKAQRILDLQAGKYNLYNKDKEDGSFIIYFKKQAEVRKKSQGSYGNWMSAYEKLLVFAAGKDLTFKDITPELLEKIKKFLLEAKTTKSNTKLSRNSALSYFNKIRAALQQAFEDRLINENPAKRVKGIKEAETHREFLTVEEVRKLINVPCEIDVLKRAFLFSVMTGLRWSDVNGLKWRNLTFSEELGNYQIRYTQQKTKKAEILPISEQAIAFIGEREDADDKIFKGLRYSAWYNLKLQQWIMKAGINKSITFHCARHTYATLMLTHDVDLYTVSKLLGHKNIKTTQIYAQVVDQRKVDAVNQLPNFNL
jgi:integrase